jgi:hypothetical protein
MELVVVERLLDKPYTFAELNCMERSSASCFNLHQVRALRSYFSKDRTRVICLYEAPDAEAVRVANRKAGLPFDNVWSADVLYPEAGGPERQPPER